MNWVFKLLSSFALCISLMGSASAVAATFDMSGDPGYLGYLGNVESGIFGGDIGTQFVDAGSGITLNFNASLTSVVAIPHWYNFTLDNTMIISDFLELGDDVANITISFFDSNGLSPVAPIVSSSPHGYQSIGTFWADSSWWMKVDGVSTGANDNYTVKLSAAPVPLPPAVLLFGSALAGFGVLGRQKRQRISA